MNKINDLAFVIDNILVVLIEQQSSISQNLPLRLLEYVSRIYENIIDNNTIYREKRMMIPRPEFYVLYNGRADYDDIQLCLSASFIREGQQDSDFPLELIVKVLNINKGHNAELTNKSVALQGYTEFVAKARSYTENGLALEEAIQQTIEECFQQDILTEFLLRHGSEVKNMLFDEWNLDRAKEVWREEGIEEGINIGMERTALKTHFVKVVFQDSLFLADCTNRSEETAS